MNAADFDRPVFDRDFILETELDILRIYQVMSVSFLP
jgi:hypothetical protein